MEVVRFIDGPTRHETWELADAGWDDWSAIVDKFLAHAISTIVTEYASESVEWLEINQWPYSGRLIVFPSADGPHGDRGERICFELASEHLLAVFRRVKETSDEANRDWVWVGLSRRVWVRVGECLVHGSAGQALIAARRRHRLRVVGYDYNPGEGLWWLTEQGAFRADLGVAPD